MCAFRLNFFAKFTLKINTAEFPPACNFNFNGINGKDHILKVASFDLKGTYDATFCCFLFEFIPFRNNNTQLPALETF